MSSIDAGGNLELDLPPKQPEVVQPEVVQGEPMAFFPYLVIRMRPRVGPQFTASHHSASTLESLHLILHCSVASKFQVHPQRLL